MTTLLQKSLEDRLQMFVFFHLGSDALVRTIELQEGFQISIEHRRIDPIHFNLSKDELRRLLESPEAFEGYLLGHLTRHRR